MRQLFLIALIAIALPACATQQEPKYISWKSHDIIYKSITLDDPIREERYSFDDHGVVALTYGKKNKWLTSPLMKWDIQHGNLRILDYDNKLFQEFRLLSRDEKGFRTTNKFNKTVYFILIQA